MFALYCLPVNLALLYGIRNWWKNFLFVGRLHDGKFDISFHNQVEINML